LLHAQADINHAVQLSEKAAPNTKTTLPFSFLTNPCSAGQGFNQLIIAHAQADIDHEASLSETAAPNTKTTLPSSS
jgi:hypothetical protein